MTKYVTINLFDAEYSAKTAKLSDTIEAFKKLHLANRWRGDIRLDEIIPRPASKVVNTLTYELNFVKKRTLGPGKVDNAKQVGNIGLVGTEAFGEETTAIYVPSKKWLLVLHNQYGIGPARIAEYFNAINPAAEPLDYSFSPKIDSDALKRMKKMTHFSAVEIVANVGAFDNTTSALGKSVKSTVTAAKAARLHLRLEANEPHKKGASLVIQPLKDAISALLKTDDVDKIEVKGGDAADEKDQVINLMNEKLRQRFPDTELQVDRHRYTFGSKADLIARACRGWMDKGIT